MVSRGNFLYHTKSEITAYSNISKHSIEVALNVFGFAPKEGSKLAEK